VTAQEGRIDERDVYIPLNDRGMTSGPTRRQMEMVLVAELTNYGNWGPCRVVPMDGSSRAARWGRPGLTARFGAWSPMANGCTSRLRPETFPHLAADSSPTQTSAAYLRLTEEEGIAMAPDGRSFVTAVGVAKRFHMAS